MNIRHILLPLDFSADSFHLVEEAVSFARLLEASLTLVHVFDPPHQIKLQTKLYPRGASAPLTVKQYLEADVERRMPDYETYARARGVRINHQLHYGHPAETILRVVEAIQPDMIMMGTHGRMGLRRAFEGSVAEEVIRHASIPVFVLRIQRPLDVQTLPAAALQVLDELEG